jgi:flagellar protein FlaG
MPTEAISSSVKAVPPVGDGFRAFTPSRPISVPDAAMRLDLAEAIDEIASRAAESGAALDFRVDEESGRTIVSVVDRRDGTVLRQMPSEEALRIARNLARYESQLIEARA